jgi:hypothetical protein
LFDEMDVWTSAFPANSGQRILKTWVIKWSALELILSLRIPDYLAKDKEVATRPPDIVSFGSSAKKVRKIDHINLT